ncbi:hypothetical protein RHSIM_Rhsim05G0111300 [Rhododendron simsii]|uniref:NAC domain-containing protein n=1 Tax=Rhododendron simsii TaxID=118357 RepID=A0A834H2B9_RHOSS|nr:hypothetical protein RHSIM_Rhsim05G0111300 [Rhododendron simsii]
MKMVAGGQEIGWMVAGPFSPVVGEDGGIAGQMRSGRQRRMRSWPSLVTGGEGDPAAGERGEWAAGGRSEDGGATVVGVGGRGRKEGRRRFVREAKENLDKECAIRPISKALAEGNKWYYFSRKTQNRISGSGFWKPLGADEPVFSTDTGSKKVGMKKHYVFYKTTEATAEVKTNWIMQEFRLSDCGSTSSSGRSSKRRGNQKVDYSTWVLCRVYERNCDDGDDSAELSCLDEVFLSLDDLDEISLPNN